MAQQGFFLFFHIREKFGITNVLTMIDQSRCAAPHLFRRACYTKQSIHVLSYTLFCYLIEKAPICNCVFSNLVLKLT